MVLELLGLLGLPVGVATAEGIRHHQEKEREAEETEEMRDFHIQVFCGSSSRKRDQVDGSIVVLKGGKLYLTKRDPQTFKPLPLPNSSSASHEFTGFYLDFEPKPAATNSMFERLNKPPPLRGLVSTISDSPPTLNWIYVDKHTHELRYGSRVVAEGHILGPWGWTDDEEGVVLEGWEGFVAVEEKKDLWAVYYDRDDDNLKDRVKGKRVLSCSLERKFIDDEDGDKR